MAYPRTTHPLTRQRWLLLGPLGFFTLFYFYPLSAIVRFSFLPERWASVWLDMRYLVETLWFTVWQAAVSTLLTLLLALPASYVFAHYRFPGKQWLKAVSTLPFVLPTVVVANAFTALLGPNSLLNQWLQRGLGLDAPPLDLHQTIWIILLAHIFYNYSVAFRVLSSFWHNLSPDLEQAAQLLGASPRRAFWAVTLPLLRPALTSAATLVFVFCFTSFGVILILGGPRFATLETEIYHQTVNLFNLPVAATLSLFQIFFTFGLLGLYTARQRPLVLPTRRATPRPPRRWRDQLAVGAMLSFMLVLLGTPLLALMTRSFTTESGWSWRYYQALFDNERGSVFFVPPIEAIGNSIGIALIAVLMAVSLGLISARLLASDQLLPPRLRRWLDPLLMLPLATSAVTLGFGYLLALNTPPLNLRDSPILIPIAHTLIAMPFVIRAILPALQRINPHWREAAQLLGAAPHRIWWEIDWPLIRRVLLVGAVFAFTISMGEFGATLFLARPDTPTMPVAIYRFLGRPGALNYGQALAMSSLLMLVCALGFVIIERFRGGSEEGF